MFYRYNLYTLNLLHSCPSWERDTSSVTLPEVSSIFLFPATRGLSGKFFITQNKGLRAKGVVHCTDCMATEVMPL